MDFLLPIFPRSDRSFTTLLCAYRGFDQCRVRDRQVDTESHGKKAQSFHTRGKEEFFYHGIVAVFQPSL